MTCVTQIYQSWQCLNTAGAVWHFGDARNKHNRKVKITISLKKLEQLSWKWGIRNLIDVDSKICGLKMVTFQICHNYAIFFYIHYQENVKRFVGTYFH